MTVKTGLNAKIYRDTAYTPGSGVATPTWNLIAHVVTDEMPRTREEIDASDRSYDTKLSEAGQKTEDISGELKYEDNDDDWDWLAEIFDENTPVHLAFVPDDITIADLIGREGIYKCHDASEMPRGATDPYKRKFLFKPCPNADLPEPVELVTT